MAHSFAHDGCVGMLFLEALKTEATGQTDVSDYIMNGLLCNTRSFSFSILHCIYLTSICSRPLLLSSPCWQRQWRLPRLTQAPPPSRLLVRLCPLVSLLRSGLSAKLHTSMYRRENVVVSDGFLNLIVPGGQQDDEVIWTAEISTDFTVASARVETYAILTDVPGVCNGKSRQ
jgi:hypothetical protein